MSVESAYTVTLSGTVVTMRRSELEAHIIDACTALGSVPHGWQEGVWYRFTRKAAQVAQRRTYEAADGYMPTKPSFGLRDAAKQHECPKCSAAQGDDCTDSDGQPREAVHMERLTAYRAASKPARINPNTWEVEQ